MISIARDFIDTPGARYISEGAYSGELFLKDHLLPKFEEAVAKEHILLIDLDGMWGYPSSFVSGSFGKLSVDKGKDLVLKHIQFKSNSESKILKFIGEINNPQNK